MALRRLERFDIFDAVYDPPANLEIIRPLLQPAPSLQCARAKAPSPRQLNLVKVAEISRG